MMLAQDHVLRDGEILDHAIPHAFFGDVGEHALGQFSRGKACDIFAFEDDTSVGELAQAGDRLCQLTLPVS